MPNIAVALLSGGLDSTTALWKVKNTYKKIHTLTFAYGAKEERVSIKVSKNLSKLSGSNHNIISLPWLGKFSKRFGSALVSNEEVPHPEENDMDNNNRAKETARAVWVPARNLIFLSIAASYAESVADKVDILAGFNKEEAITFLDNSREFVNSMNRAIEFGVLKKVRIVTPLIEMDKEQITRLSLELDVPVEYTSSCYNPIGLDEKNRPIHCGRCESCIRRKMGFKNLGRTDKTVYQVGRSSQKSQV